ncbi:phosphoribosyltransferase family protein [Filibacter tadaridae]|uniref:Phosphoribosyl transferase domain protein n=1 Tax=Filibacter tadaridae TaxID=2483811 RepID=A0A3P5X096_9BACL|nr:phosphoribosyltransferase family protein [Filibacter tadaridae]VDC24016.1 Phosphoribosyl transferase domain protein [Filibacter tadaridae]
MNECLLCDSTIASTPTWKALLGLDDTTIICQDCSKKFVHAEIRNDTDELLDQVTSLYSYNEAMRDYLHQFKFLQDIALAGIFAHELHAQLKGNAIICPIPMHPHKKIMRTFAPVDELLTSARIPFTHLLEKTGTESMGEKTKDQRLVMNPLFALKPGTMIQPTTYRLVDDIYTTGTTLRHAATVLKQAGAKRVEAVTLIRA